MRFVNDYRGSSFVGLLEAEHPQLVPRWTESGGVAAAVGERSFVHGTTICALEFAGGVMLGGDRRATFNGSVIMNEEVTKVFKVDDYSIIAIAGTFGPSVKMAKLFQVELEHYEKIEGVPLSAEGKANKLSLMIEMNLPAAMQGLVIMPLYVGFDVDAGTGSIYEYDITGGMFTKSRREPYASSGSGGERARATFEHLWRENLGKDDAVELMRRALAFAAKRDAATGLGDYIAMAATADGVETVLGESE